MGGKLSDHFRDFDPNPVATASIAQVHNATLKSNGKKVVVKVRIADVKSMVGDVRSMLQTAVALKRLGLDNGVDFPTIFRAYLDVIEGEFDFTAEAAKIGEFTALFEHHGLADRVMIPEVVEELSTAEVLVMERVRGIKLLSVLNRARQRRKRPACPPVAAARHANGGRGLVASHSTPTFYNPLKTIKPPTAAFTRHCFIKHLSPPVANHCIY